MKLTPKAYKLIASCFAVVFVFAVSIAEPLYGLATSPIKSVMSH